MHAHHFADAAYPRTIQRAPAEPDTYGTAHASMSRLRGARAQQMPTPVPVRGMSAAATPSPGSSSACMAGRAATRSPRNGRTAVAVG
jgi:hypothetical protein